MQDRHLTSIEDAGRNHRARRLLFSDGTERMTSAAVVKRLGLEPDSPVDAYSLEEAEASSARDRALRLVGSRERSRRDVYDRLVADGYPITVAEHICERFEELSLIDDDRFARMLVRSRLRAGYGPRRILDELRRHGVDEPAAREAILDESADTDDALAALVARHAPHTRKDEERTMRRLVSRGHSPSAVRAAIEAFVRRDE